MRNLKNINNMILNIIASVIPTFVLQLFINPYLTKRHVEIQIKRAERD